MSNVERIDGTACPVHGKDLEPAKTRSGQWHPDGWRVLACPVQYCWLYAIERRPGGQYPNPMSPAIGGGK